MGPLEDLYAIWNNRPLYDVSQIISPVLVIYGEDDWFAEKDMRSKLTGAKRKRKWYFQMQHTGQYMKKS